jgi:hypothetical protein
VSRRIVLIGATGFFGRRLAERLAALEGIELILTSRDEARARKVAFTIRGAHRNAKITAIAFDRNDPYGVERLRALSPWLIIDASGPFQSASYDLARATLELGAHWIDLADARDYLLGFKAALDPIARRKGLVARAGASSTPALSTAVVEDIARRWQRLDSVDIAIMPGGAGQVGSAVIRAILGYAGTTIATFEESAPAEVTGWGSVKRVRVPGLGVRYLSPVETADAALLPERFGVTSRVTFYAGLESRLVQFGLLFLAKLRRRGLVGNLEPLAPLLESARRVTGLFASDRGGMTVDCAGLDADRRQIWERWCLIAEKGEGPNVPVLPAVALTRALLGGGVEPGAGVAIGVLPLDAIEPLMRGPTCKISRVTIHAGSHSLFELACGDDGYRQLPGALKAFHDADGPSVWTGKADIDASSSLFGRLISTLFGFPPSGCNVAVTVTVDRRGGDEIWTRDFAGRRFASHLATEGRNIVSERFGPFTILLRVKARGGEIEMPVVGWRIGPVKLPLALAPKSETREFAGDDGRFHFDVGIALPLVGLLAHYRGWLEPKRERVRHGNRQTATSISSAD